MRCRNLVPATCAGATARARTQAIRIRQGRCSVPGLRRRSITDALCHEATLRTDVVPAVVAVVLAAAITPVAEVAAYCAFAPLAAAATPGLPDARAF